MLWLLWFYDPQIKKSFDTVISRQILYWSFDMNLFSFLISWSVFPEFFDLMIFTLKNIWHCDLQFAFFNLMDW